MSGSPVLAGLNQPHQGDQITVPSAMVPFFTTTTMPLRM
jgi:hypothetical protein